MDDGYHSVVGHCCLWCLRFCVEVAGEAAGSGNESRWVALPINRSTAVVIANGVPGAKVETHSPSQAAHRADQDARLDAIDDADADIGGDVGAVAVFTRDDLHVSPR